MPKKKNPHSGYVKPDYHSQNKEKQNDKPAKLKKIKLRSSLDIYNRLLHDQTLPIDLNNVYIGYSDNVLGDQEMPILKWVMIDKGGDIPMHHILYFVLILDNDERLKLWDRKTKLDRLYCSGNTNKQQSLKFILKSNPQIAQNKKIKSNYTTENKPNNTKKSQTFKYLVVLDFEATCDEHRNISPQEIIEWPAIIIDTSTCKILNSNIFHYYIKPKYNPQLTSFCTQLTGITQKLMDTTGATNNIKSVVQHWNEWCLENDLLPQAQNEPNACIVTCGDWDLKTMWTVQKSVSKCGTPALFHSWINIKKIFKHNMQKLSGVSSNKRYGMGMMGMLNCFGIKHEGRHHSGIDDVKNICKLVQKLLMNNVKFDYTTKHFGKRSILDDMNINFKASKNILKHKSKKISKSYRSELISEMIEQIDDCILTVQTSLDKAEEKEDIIQRKEIAVGTKCILHSLQNMTSNNGKLCKIMGKFNMKESRYPVYVYDGKERVLIKPCNLKIVGKKHVQIRDEINIIYDMETGDPDDLFAVLFLISHPRVNLRAITITPGTLSQVGAIKNLLFNKLMLKQDSILVGSANPNHKKSCIPNSGIWARVCGPIQKKKPDGLGCDIIHETLSKYRECIIVTGAPLTNLYNYVMKYCTCSMDMLRATCTNKKLTWFCQGGFAGDNVVPKKYRLNKFDGKQFVATWNFNGNVKAAEYLLLNKHCNDVFDKRYLVSKNVCHGVYYNNTFHLKMRQFKDKHPALRIIYDAMDTYMHKRKNGKKFHDVLAAVAAINLDAVEFKQIIPCVQQGKNGFEWGSRLSSDSNIFISIKHNEEDFFQTFVGLN